MPGWVDIDSVTFDEQMEGFLAAYVLGQEHSGSRGDEFKKNVGPWLDQSGWSLYLARVEGRPPAAATLFIQDAVGYFADCATVPSFRGRGLHAALLRRRLLLDASTAMTANVA